MIPYEPTKIEIPFAYEGARNEIPTEGGEETGNASLKSGFPTITSQPLSQGGIPPQRKDFNGILYLLSAYAYYAQSGGLYAWDSGIDYAVNCVVTYGNNIYICVANNGASTAAGAVEPGSNEDYWIELFVYLLRASGGDVGSPVNPMYIANGQMVASTANVGSGKNPLYMENGEIKASTEDVGADDTPVFLKAGVLTACSSGGAGVKDYSLGTAGYVRFEMGLIVQWGTQSTTSSDYSGGRRVYSVKFPVAFTSSTSFVILKCVPANSEGNHVKSTICFYSQTSTTATTRHVSDSVDEKWLAIGY